MKKYFFLFTIGPVQQFISQARKTQDLYSASRILSDLIDNAIKELDKLNVISENDMIFPDRNIDSKPNRFISLISTDDPKKIVEIEKAVRENFKSIAYSALKKNGIPTHIDFDKQIENFLEIYWVVAPYYDNYLSQYEKIERFLGAVKNIRAFGQLKEQGRKCALCGERNALFYKPNKSADKKTNMTKPVIISDNRFIKGEGLCAVCCVKRFYEKEPFPSTVKISLMDTLYKVELSSEGKGILERYTNRFKKTDFNEQFFLEENLTENYFKKHDLDNYLGELEAVKEKQKDLKKFVHEKNLKLAKYYALILFDGDDMGRWLSGEKIEDKKKLEAFHKKLSAAMGEFADFSRKYLTNPLGKTVYASGDDFLGFINLNHLFDVLHKLREEFDKQVNRPLAKKFMFADSNDKITFSAGVAIAHYKTPLSIVLEKARAMEKKAKNVEGKNSVGFALLKHSGNIGETVFKWNYDDEININLMKDLSNALKNWISNKFLYSLRDEFLRLFDENTGIEPDIVETEIYRLMARRKRKNDISEELIRNLSQKLVKLFNEYRNSDYSENFFSFIEVCDFIARETNDA